MPVKFEADFNTKNFENNLKIFSSALGNIFNELLKPIGEEMAEEAKGRAPVRTGALRNAIKFLNTENGGVLTTRKTLKKSNVWYSAMVEKSRTIKPKKEKYLIFKIDGDWKKVSSVNVKGQDYMTSVYNEYFGSPSSKGYKRLTEELEKRINEEITE
jgi:hypothetical protein